MYINYLEDAIYEAYEYGEIDSYDRDYLLDILEEKVTNKQKHREKNFKKRIGYNEKDGTYDTGEIGKDGKPIRQKLNISGVNSSKRGAHYRVDDDSINISKHDIREKPMSSMFTLKHEEGHAMVRNSNIASDADAKLKQYMRNAEKYIRYVNKNNIEMNDHDRNPEELAVDTYSVNKLKKMYPGKDVTRACNTHIDTKNLRKQVKDKIKYPEKNDLVQLSDGSTISDLFVNYKNLINDLRRLINLKKKRIEHATSDAEKAEAEACIKKCLTQIEKITKDIESIKDDLKNDKSITDANKDILNNINNAIKTYRKDVQHGFDLRREFVKKELEREKNGIKPRRGNHTITHDTSGKGKSMYTTTKESVYDNIILAYEYGEIDEYDRDYLLESLDQAIYERNAENKKKKDEWENKYGLYHNDGKINRRFNRDFKYSNVKHIDTKHLKNGSLGFSSSMTRPHKYSDDNKHDPKKNNTADEEINSYTYKTDGYYGEKHRVIRTVSQQRDKRNKSNKIITKYNELYND